MVMVKICSKCRPSLCVRYACYGFWLHLRNSRGRGKEEDILDTYRYIGYGYITVIRYNTDDCCRKWPRKTCRQGRVLEKSDNRQWSAPSHCTRQPVPYVSEGHCRWTCKHNVVTTDRVHAAVQSRVMVIFGHRCSRRGRYFATIVY